MLKSGLVNELRIMSFIHWGLPSRCRFAVTLFILKDVWVHNYAHYVQNWIGTIIFEFMTAISNQSINGFRVQNIWEKISQRLDQKLLKLTKSIHNKCIKNFVDSCTIFNGFLHTQIRPEDIHQESSAVFDHLRQTK